MIQSWGTRSVKAPGEPGSRRGPVALARLAHVVLENVEEIGAEGGAVGIQRGHPGLGARLGGEGLGHHRLRALARPARLGLHLDRQRRHLADAPWLQILRRRRLMARAANPHFALILANAGTQAGSGCMGASWPDRARRRRPI